VALAADGEAAVCGEHELLLPSGIEVDEHTVVREQLTHARHLVARHVVLGRAARRREASGGRGGRGGACRHERQRDAS
jgi:hypothetical protein